MKVYDTRPEEFKPKKKLPYRETEGSKLMREYYQHILTNKDYKRGVRDSQKHRVYRAERKFRNFLPLEDSHNLDFVEVRQIVRDILADERVVEKFGYRATFPVIVKSGQGGNHAWCNPVKRRFSFPLGIRDKYTAIHEVAHLLATVGSGHDAEYCGVLVYLIGVLYDEDMANTLTKILRREGAAVWSE